MDWGKTVKLGIVGHEAKKFSDETRKQAIEVIEAEILRIGPERVISGRCHLGGVDIWAVEAAARLGYPYTEYPPKVLRWSAPGGFKDRNLKIAYEADLVLVVVVAQLPPGYPARSWEKGDCYHCTGRFGLPKRPPHVKSGACWTANHAKAAEWRIIS